MRKLVTRKAWGARRPRSTDRLAPERVRWLVVHYSAMNADEQARHRNCAARVRGIQRFHMQPGGLGAERGGSDLAYHWIVCKHGYIFRGRGWRVMGGATFGANAFTVAVCFLGDDTANRDDVTDAGREAIREVHRFVRRNAPKLRGIAGHRDFVRTACPGDELYRFLRTLDRHP